MKKTLLGLVVLFGGTLSLAFAGKEEDAAKYTKILKTSKDAKSKAEAATELGNLGQIKKSYAKDAVPHLVQGCKDKDAGLRAAAAEALGKVDPPEDVKAAELLADMVKSDKDIGVRMAAARGLAAMGPSAKNVVPTLREVMSKEDKKSKIYRATMEAMRSINSK
jgi:HEAT repeat protein